ncbi:hypothetical protein [Micromonospora sp. DH14]|uniref:hypothetical protein n=1 Tax=Micromonospora sp. DH14 TaxID=3040120 RepID=UPI0024414D2C|nr:hypothetical protein [Micromonospora sp. DH14]MDG9678937.1 hypothetical protein [Micromonospora sp. DH14]
MALVAVLATAACDGASDPPVAPTAGAAASSVASTAPTASAGPVYRAQDLELCKRTDLRPLAELSLTVARTDPKPPLGQPGAACLFEMRTKDGHQANLRVEASTPASEQEARLLYRATAQVTVMTPAGAITGVGDEAEAFTRRSEPGFKYAEYMVRARTGNLVVKVWLAVGGVSYAATDTLGSKALTLLKATQAAVPTV